MDQTILKPLLKPLIFLGLLTLTACTDEPVYIICNYSIMKLDEKNSTVTFFLDDQKVLVSDAIFTPEFINWDELNPYNKTEISYRRLDRIRGDLEGRKSAKYYFENIDKCNVTKPLF